MLDAFRSIVDILTNLVNLLVNIVESLINLISNIPNYLNVVTGAIGWLPNVLMPFALASVSLYIVLFLLNRRS